MAKKFVTIDVEDKDLTASTEPVKAEVKKQETKEIETFGIVEINNASAVKKIKSNKDKGFEKNVSGEAKRTIKSKTSQVEDYFDFSFRTNEKAKVEVLKEEPKTKIEKVTEVKAMPKTEEIKKQEKILAESVNFDSEANQVIRIARIGSLFDCDIRSINA